MLDLSWINSLPEPTKSIVISTLGKVAADMAGRLINAGGYAIKKAFAPGPRREALERAMAQALLVTAHGLTDDFVLFQHYLGLLGEWAAREAVTGELSQVIDPRSDTTLDLALLTGEFEALGYEPELLHEELGFPDVVARFVAAFYDAAAAEPELQEPIKIGLLRGIAERAEQQVQESKKQTAVQIATRDAVRRLLPELDLDDLERAYLRGLYADCNDLSLAGKPPDEGGRQPRLQRVYVDLMTETPPALDTVLDRLGVPAEKRDQAQRALEKYGKDEASGVLETPRRREGKPPTGDWERHPLRKWAKDEETLRRAYAPLSALEAIHHFGQVVVLGDPGSGKSTLTRRLAGVLAAAAVPDLSEEERDWRAQIGDACDEWLLPVRVTLSRWARE